MCESDTSCGVRDLPLDSPSSFHASGQDLQKEKDNVESNKEKTSEGLKVWFSEQRTWSSLFSKKYNGKSSFLLVTTKSCWEKGEFQVFILDPLVDFSMSSMDFTLVGKFLRSRLDLDSLRKIVKRKWVIRGEVDITPMSNGFFSFIFNYKEDINLVLCGGSWSFGK